MIDIAHFYNPDHTREYLREPFTLLNKTIACDGHKLLINPITNPLASEFTNLIVERIVISTLAASYKPVPKILWPNKSPCPLCMGTGKSYQKKCDECDGHGYLDFETIQNDYQCECKSCNGTGVIASIKTEKTCKKCNGEKSIWCSSEYAVIDGIHINPHYLSIITAENDLMVSTDDPNYLYFKSGEQFGCIMPMMK